MSKFIIIESPFRGATAKLRKRNLIYARRALLHSINEGEVPFASHLLYTQVLDDNTHESRELGIDLNLKMLASKLFNLAVYHDYGVSPGMNLAVARAKRFDLTITYREIGKNP